MVWWQKRKFPPRNMKIYWVKGKILTLGSHLLRHMFAWTIMLTLSINPFVSPSTRTCMNYPYTPRRYRVIRMKMGSAVTRLFVSKTQLMYEILLWQIYCIQRSTKPPLFLAEKHYMLAVQFMWWYGRLSLKWTFTLCWIHSLLSKRAEKDVVLANATPPSYIAP